MRLCMRAGSPLRLLQSASRIAARFCSSFGEIDAERGVSRSHFGRADHPFRLAGFSRCVHGCSQCMILPAADSAQVGCHALTMLVDVVGCARSEGIMHHASSTARREFLKFLLASPARGCRRRCCRVPRAPRAGAGRRRYRQSSRGFEASSTSKRPHTRRSMPGHWAHMASGVDNDAHAARQPRRLLSHAAASAPFARRDKGRHARRSLRDDLREPASSSVRLAARNRSTPTANWPSPRAAKARNTLQFLSTATSTGVEDVNKALGRPVWYQLRTRRRRGKPTKCCLRSRGSGRLLGHRASTVRQHRPGETAKPTCAPRPKDLNQCLTCHEGLIWRRTAPD